MRSKKLFASVMTLALAGGILTGCGSSKKSEDKTSSNPSTEKQTSEKEEGKEKSEDKILTKLDGDVEITFRHAMNGGQEDALKKLTDEFEKKNPNIKVNLQNQGNYGDLNQKLVATMQSVDDLPTITQAYPDRILDFDKEGLIADLKPYVKNDEIGIKDYDDILPGIRQEVEQGDRILGLPFNKSTEVLRYNKTMFDELGLKVPTNFEELEEVSKKIYDKKGIPGVGFDALSNFYATYLKTKGIDMGKDLDVTCPESEEAVNYYMDGIKGGYFRIAGTDNYLSEPFTNQQVAAYIGSNAGEVRIKDGAKGKFEYAAAPYPAETCVQQGTNIYMLDKASPEEKLAAYTYLKFLTDKDSQIQFAIDTGYMPARKSAIEDDSYKNSGSAIAPILADATKNLFSRPLVPGSQKAYNDTAAFLEQVLSNKDSDVKTELKNFKPTYEQDYEAD